MNSFGIDTILKLLPHRYPFLLIDKVLDYTLNSKITAIKNVSMNEPFFQGHFPNHPVMPGVLLVEAMAQAAGLMMIKSAQDEGITEKFVTYFMTIDNAKFRRLVVPGDQLRIEVELAKRRSNAAKFSGKVFVEDQLTAEAEFFCMVAPESAIEKK